MKKTAGILTMHSVVNYGSRLQTLATYEFIRKEGYEPKVIDYRYPTEYHLKNSHNFTNNKRSGCKCKESLPHRIKTKLAKIILRPDKNKRLKKFNEFYNKHILLTRPYNSKEELSEDPPIFNVYVAGSDQIWNPFFIHHDTSFFLAWTPNGSKKISYASSVAVKHIPEEFIGNIKDNLSSFSAISVRENPEFLNHLLNKDVKQVLDPTFLLTKTEWTKYFNKKPIIRGKYILCYILSYSYDPYPYIYEVINKVKKELGYKVIIIDGDLAKYFQGYNIYVNGGPEEFLNLFYNAEFVITTSFHGTAFALNFERNFLSVIDNASNNDNRILNICRKFGLEDKCIVRKNDDASKIVLPEIDTDYLRNKLEEQRIDSIEYFRSSLNDKK